MSRPYNNDTTNVEVVADLAAHIRDKTILTTGASPNSIGAAFLAAIAPARPRMLIVAGRDPARVRATLDALALPAGVQTRALALDLGDLASVRAAAAEVNSWDDVPSVDVLVNSAGIMATPFKLKGGVESQFAVNHVGHWLFTNLVMDKLLRSEKQPRVVAVSSSAHRLSQMRWPDINFSDGELYDKWTAYGQSKTANMLMALYLADRLGSRGLGAYSVHPGIVATSLGSHLDWDADMEELRSADRVLGNEEGFGSGPATWHLKPLENGAVTYIVAAFDPELTDRNGAYLLDGHVADPLTETVKPWATSLAEAKRLWRLSEELTGQDFQY